MTFQLGKFSPLGPPADYAYSNPNHPPPCFKIEIGLYNLKNFPEFQSAP